LQALRDVTLGPVSYGMLLVFLVVDYVFLTVGWHSDFARIVSAVWLGLTVMLAFRTSEVPRRIMNIVRVSVAMIVAAAIVAALGGLLHHTRVTTQTVLGVLCIYILIGLVFANADYGMQLVSGNSFFALPGHHGPADFAYFSYITMAAVGYGDLSPATGVPRTSAVLEALTGRILLVVLIARLVAMYTPTLR
jgi:hypothetical protein